MNFQIEGLAYHLELVRQGKIRRLIINLPPRSLKSMMTSVAWPAYVLGRDPSKRLVVVSYGTDLANTFANQFRTVINSPSYKTLFPLMRPGMKNTESEVITAQNGYRFATSIDGGLMGRGGDFLIIDDPLKPSDALNDARPPFGLFSLGIGAITLCSEVLFEGQRMEILGRARPNRHSFIGGSDARIIMGDDEGALVRLWREKRREIEPGDISGNLIVQLGVVTEELNRRWYEANTGHAVVDVQRQIRHPALHWMGATLDGRVEATGAVFEAKFMLPWAFSEEAAVEIVCATAAA